MIARALCFSLFLIPVFSTYVPEANRIDCNPAPGASQYDCENRGGCIWDSSSSVKIPTVPRCYVPPEMGYRVKSQTDGSVSLEKDITTKWYGKDISPLSVTYENIGKTLHVKIGAPNSARYEPPLNLPREPSKSAESLQFASRTSSGVFSFKVLRESSDRTLWDTSIGGLIFADQFIQIATYLPSANIYGFGENAHQSLKHDMTLFKTWPMFARDEPPYTVQEQHKNLYGVHPFYILVEPDGMVHGVLILNSNAQEITTGPAPSLTYRTIGGLLDMYFFPGPTAEEVIGQYTALIGKPTLPAYWALGFQLCRWGYKTLDRLKTVVQRTKASGIPYDVQWMDIDYMDHRQDFTYNKVNWTGLPEFVKSLHDDGMKNVLILDPATPADYDPMKRGMEKKVFIRWPDQSMVPDLNDKYDSTKGSDVMLGTVWPDKNAPFPDWYAPNANDWWADEVKRFHEIVPFDGLWIDMNEPSNFATNDPNPWYWNDKGLAHARTPQLWCPHDILDSPPYATWGVYLYQQWGDKVARLSEKTLCMNAMHGNGLYRHYDVHNLFGYGESIATRQALTNTLNKRSLLISRSTFVSSGRYASHWLGDNTATWDDLRTSIIGILEFNFFGIPFVGADICGFNGNTNEELCLRWQQLGAFYPFSRNHNGLNWTPQDPSVWPTVAAATKKAMEFRYHYLPYLYSLLYDSSLKGKTVARPLFFEFPHDTTALRIDKQFLWGDGLLVSPVITQGATTVRAYLPGGKWYSLFDTNYGKAELSTGWRTFPVPTTSLIPVHVRGGRILPRQAPAKNTVASRGNPLEVLVALGMNHEASGFLYWDDGDTLLEKSSGDDKYYYYIEFNYHQSDTMAVLNMTSHTNAASKNVPIPSMDIIEILGYQYTPQWDTFKLDDKAVSIDTGKSSEDVCGERLFATGDKMVDLGKFTVGKLLLSWKHTKNSHC